MVVIQKKIYEIRGHKVMLDFDLAELYEVETRILNRAVKRNLKRFPADFMFRLTTVEWKMMSSQIGMTYPSKRPKVALPYVFTEHGVTMLASVLRSERAISMNIAIVRAFLALRQFAVNYKELSYQIKELQNTVGNHDKHLNELFRALELLLQDKESQEDFSKRKRIGFKIPKK